ncbi:MAG TPA: GNAT family N-acetyltransferase [Marmoricola sp.]|nr:GNAT family N-acetyltransferase [Marmoricola sp.]
MSELIINEQPAESRYVAERDGVQVGHIEYETEGSVLTLTHTIVPEEYAGQGIASALVRGVLDDLRERGLRAVPQCPFIASWIEKHPDYQDLVAS